MDFFQNVSVLNITVSFPVSMCFQDESSSVTRN